MNRDFDIALYSFDFQFMLDICRGSKFSNDVHAMLGGFQKYLDRNGTMLNDDIKILQGLFEQCYDYTPEKYPIFSADSKVISRALQNPFPSESNPYHNGKKAPSVPDIE